MPALNSVCLQPVNWEARQTLPSIDRQPHHQELYGLGGRLLNLPSVSSSVKWE